MQRDHVRAVVVAGQLRLPDVADRVDSNTWANVDFGRKMVRNFFIKCITKAIDHYEPSDICFEYGWGMLASNATYSPANPATSQPHARLRVQADVRQWTREHHPEMLILINDKPGTPSQLFADCQVIEDSVMSDLDLEAGRTLASAMSSMDYFADHDELGWSRQVMSDLSRRCSIGIPCWPPMYGPDDYERKDLADVLRFLSKDNRIADRPGQPRDHERHRTFGRGYSLGQRQTSASGSQRPSHFGRRTTYNTNDSNAKQLPRSD